MLNTDFEQEVTEFFLAIGTTVGVGITADFVDWARILRAIWDVRSFQEISPPIELEDLARLARINMLTCLAAASSISTIGVLAPFCQSTELLRVTGCGESPTTRFLSRYRGTW